MEHTLRDTGGTARNTDRPTLSTDTIFDTLSNRRRRYVLHYLKRTGGSVSIRELSEQLAAWELGVDRAEVRPKERKRLYTALHQTHLPKMDALEVLEYDRNRGEVELNGSLDEFDIYFDMVGRAEIPWSQFYLAIGGLLTSLAALAYLGVEPLSALTRPGPVLAVSLLFTTVALYHVLRDRQQAIGSADTPPEYAPPSTDAAPDCEVRRN